jgi:hypothetical protein
MTLSDERAKMLKEYIDGIKVVKYNGWEEIVI